MPRRSLAGRAVVIGPEQRRLVLVSGPPRSGKTTIAGPVEVFCQCPAQEYRRRYADRASSRHVVHVDSHLPHLPDEAFTRSDRPIGLGAVLTVDTTAPVDIPALAREVRDRLP